MDTRKTLYEEFASFFENPTRDRLRELLRHNVGESANCDFKEQWPSFSSLARHLLGLGNSGGGCIIIGVAERADHSLEPIGLDTLVDKADFMKGVKRFLPSALLGKIDAHDFPFEASEYPKLVGKKFQVVFVGDDPKHLPFAATSDGDGIRSNAIYVRRGASTEEVNYEELQRIINRRIETGHSSKNELDLAAHIEQLKILYYLLDERREELYNFREAILDPHGDPELDLIEDFLDSLIAEKRKRIRIELGINDSNESHGESFAF